MPPPRERAGGDVIRMPIGLVRQRDRLAAARANQLDNGAHLLGHVAELAIGQPEVHAPRGAEHVARFFGLAQTLVRRAVGAHLAAREIAETDDKPLAT